jgi:GNAT superfamily N-acetyltransferase
MKIEQLELPASASDLNALALLLIDAVDSNAAVTFLAPLSTEHAEQWWRELTADPHPRAVLLVARHDAQIVGTVQLQPVRAVNQSHRADIAKLLVHRRHQRAGLGGQLMRAIEAQARNAGFTLLTLDTKRGDPAERLYHRAGWTEVGGIPNFALDPDGTPHEAVIFYKALE